MLWAFCLPYALVYQVTYIASVSNCQIFCADACLLPTVNDHGHFKHPVLSIWHCLIKWFLGTRIVVLDMYPEICVGFISAAISGLSLCVQSSIWHHAIVWLFTLFIWAMVSNDSYVLWFWVVFQRFIIIWSTIIWSTWGSIHNEWWVCNVLFAITKVIVCVIAKVIVCPHMASVTIPMVQTLGKSKVICSKLNEWV